MTWFSDYLVMSLVDHTSRGRFVAISNIRYNTWVCVAYYTKRDYSLTRDPSSMNINEVTVTKMAAPCEFRLYCVFVVTTVFTALRSSFYMRTTYRDLIPTIDQLLDELE